MATNDNDAPAFGRDVDDIIAEVIQLGGPDRQTDLEVEVRTHLASILEERKHREVSSELLKEITNALDQKVAIYSRVPWQWVMFAEPGRAGVEFLGVYITRALSFEHAVLKAHLAGHCPGGHADGAALPLGLPVDTAYCDRLLTFAEAGFVRDVLDANLN